MKLLRGNGLVDYLNVFDSMPFISSTSICHRRRQPWRQQFSLASAANWLGATAIAFATINVVGGFMVTDRMLRMFKKTN